MGVNITVDGLTYSGVEQMYVGGKSLALSADAGGADSMLDGYIDGSLSRIDWTVSHIRTRAFQSLNSLEYASFPNATTIGSLAFGQCSTLSFVWLPSVDTIMPQVFYTCSALTSVELPGTTNLHNGVFFSCANLERVSIPLLKQIAGTAFVKCSKLASVSFPALEIMSEAYTFSSCWLLSHANLGVVSNIGANAFLNCYNLLDVTLNSQSVALLSNSNAFQSTPIAGYTASTGGVYGSIYVPASLLTAYQSATNWAFFSERFVGV